MGFHPVFVTRHLRGLKPRFLNAPQYFANGISACAQHPLPCRSLVFALSLRIFADRRG